MKYNISTTIVFVLKAPNIEPINPFGLIDAGIFTREEICNGPMDFGPGYALHSIKGFSLVREVQRVLIVMDAEKSDDLTLMRFVMHRVVEALKLNVGALGVNFVVAGISELSDKVFDPLQGIGKMMSLMPHVGFSCISVEEGVRKTFSIMPDMSESAGYVLSINNHIPVDGKISVQDVISRIDCYRESFKSIVSVVIKGD